MPEKVLNQIKYLCKKIPKAEWSGVLFYSVNGSIKNPETMVLTLEEILPLDKGSATYTEFEFGTAYVEHMMENEHLEECKVGLIHSHNSMGVFFSGTDWSELEDNAPNHNFYLSLIVNNYMDFCAKVCFIAESPESVINTFIAKDEFGKKYSVKQNETIPATKKLIVYDCNIKSPQQNIVVEDSFVVKVDKIIQEADEKAKLKAFSIPDFTKNNKEYKSFNNKNINRNQSNYIDWDYQENYSFDDFMKSSENFNKYHKLEQKDNIEYFLSDNNIEDFALFVLNLGNPVDITEDFSDILSRYKSNRVTGKMLSMQILDLYVQLYEKFFDTVENKDAPKVFSDIAEQVIEIYEEVLIDMHNERVSTRNMLEPVIEGLEIMLNEFNK